MEWSLTLSSFEEVDLDEEPCIIPPCAHILTLESMDGHVSMSDFYSMNSEGPIVNLKNSAEPFSASEMRSNASSPYRDPRHNLQTHPLQEFD